MRTGKKRGGFVWVCGKGASEREREGVGLAKGRTYLHVHMSGLHFTLLLCLCMWGVECGVHVMIGGSCGTCVHSSPVLPVALNVEKGGSWRQGKEELQKGGQYSTMHEPSNSIQLNSERVLVCFTRKIEEQKDKGLHQRHLPRPSTKKH